MATLDSILEEVSDLTPAERTQLVEIVQEGLRRAQDEDDAAVGRRGLAAWSESTRPEDWSAYYPPALSMQPGGGGDVRGAQ